MKKYGLRNGTKLFSVLMMLLFLASESQAQQTAKRDENGIGYLEYLPPGYDGNQNKYPAIIFLHGAGEKGNGSANDLELLKRNGPPKHINNGSTMCFTNNGIEECFIVLSPQTARWTWVGYEIIPFVDYALDNYRIDPDRVYLTGLSMGGEGTWKVAYSQENSSNRFAALAPVAGRGKFDEACILGENNVPVWAFHGSADNAMVLNAGQRPINGMIACGADPEPIFTVYDGVGHSGTWQRAYKVDNSLHTPNLYEWFLQQRRGEQPASAPRAPENLTVSLELPEAVLSWSSSSEDIDAFLIELHDDEENLLLSDSVAGDQLSIVFSSLEVNKNYIAKIKSSNVNGESDYGILNFSTVINSVPPVVDSVIIVDNDYNGLVLSGNWVTSTSGGNSKFGEDYYHDGNSDKGTMSAVLEVPISEGTFEVFARWFAFGNRATNVNYQISHTEGTNEITINQQLNDAEWVSLGEYDFKNSISINISNANSDGYVVLDAFKFEGRINNPSDLPESDTELEEILIDNDHSSVSLVGSWELSTAGGRYKEGDNYYHDGNQGKGEKKVIYNLEGISGSYEVFSKWYAFDNRATNTKFEINDYNGVRTVEINQTLNNAEWVSLGLYSFNNSGSVSIDNTSTTGYVIADAIKLVPVLEADIPQNLNYAQSSELTVFPNPLKGDFYINTYSELAKEYSVKIINELNETVYSYTQKGSGILQFPFNSSGIVNEIGYLVIYIDGKPSKRLRVLIGD